MPILTNPERDLIAGTIDDIEESLLDLEGQIRAQTAEADAKRFRLAAWKKRLAEIDGTSPTATTPTTRKRQPKGANLRAISTCLEGTVVGLAVGEIKEKTGLAWSSVQRVLAQHPELFVELNGLYRLRQKPARTSVKGSIADAARTGTNTNDVEIDWDRVPDDYPEPDEPAEDDL